MLDRFQINEEKVRRKLCEDIFSIAEMDGLLERLMGILKADGEDDRRKTLAYQLDDWIKRIGYAGRGLSYWEYAKSLFVEIIRHNIQKANYIQHGQKQIEEERYRERFGSIDLNKILEIQNDCSRDEVKGFIWVLNTCVFLVPDYNFDLLYSNSNKINQTDPFYSESNTQYLEKVFREIRNGEAHLSEHDLIETD